MNPSFNLIDQPWIPCVQNDNTVKEFGLHDTFAHAHELREIAGDTPLVIASLYRLILAVLQRVFPTKTNVDWGKLWSRRSWDIQQLEAYWKDWYDRFDLFHTEKPFYQAQDELMTPKPISTLLPEMASGNVATLFDHHTDERAERFSPAQAARALLTSQTFGLAGICHPQLKRFFTDAPWARGVIFFVAGNTLFETLALNLLPYKPNGESYHGLHNYPDDQPAWEAHDPFLPERIVPRGYHDYLTWQSRKILLFPVQENGRWVVQQATISPGLRLDAEVLDPMKHYNVHEERGRLVLRFSENRALWRDSSAFLRVSAPAGNAIPPYTFSHIAGLARDPRVELNRQSTFRCMALGMANDQAKVMFFRGEHIPLPLPYFQDEGGDLIGWLSQAIQVSETGARQLYFAATKLARLLLQPDASLQEKGSAPPEAAQMVEHMGLERHYWSCMNLPFTQLIRDLAEIGEPALQGWVKTVNLTAWRAFEIAENAHIDNPRAYKAVIKAKEQLAIGLSKNQLISTKEES